MRIRRRKTPLDLSAGAVLGLNSPSGDENALAQERRIRRRGGVSIGSAVAYLDLAQLPYGALALGHRPGQHSLEARLERARRADRRVSCRGANREHLEREVA